MTLRKCLEEAVELNVTHYKSRPTYTLIYQPNKYYPPSKPHYWEGRIWHRKNYEYNHTAWLSAEWIGRRGIPKDALPIASHPVMKGGEE